MCVLCICERTFVRVSVHVIFQVCIRCHRHNLLPSFTFSCNISTEEMFSFSFIQHDSVSFCVILFFSLRFKSILAVSILMLEQIKSPQEFGSLLFE